MSDVICLGEVLVDWISSERGKNLGEATAFSKAAGGAPANVAVGLVRQGISTAFLGGIASDAFGVWLEEVLRAEGVDTSYIKLRTDAATRMAYVITNAHGDRELAEFSKLNCADEMLCADDLPTALFASAKALHFGSISLINEPAASATGKAIELATKNQSLISYDPNVRLALWPSPDRCRETIMQTLSLAHVVKVSGDELAFLTGSDKPQAARRLQAEKNIALLIVTLDSNGSHFYTESSDKHVEGFGVQFVEATGAGDAFVAGLLTQLIAHIQRGHDPRSALKALSDRQLEDMLRQANAVGALACTRRGAIPSLPSSSEIAAFLAGKTAAPSS